jgi:hypothetical protein
MAGRRPDGHTVVAHHNQVFVDASRQQLMHSREVPEANLRHLVVVALDKDFLSLQPSEIPTVVEPGEVSDNVDKIPGGNGSIPVRDDRLVHLLDGAKRAAAMPTDILMTEMGVGGEKHIHFRRPFVFATGASGVT